MQPDQDADCGNFKRAGLEINSREALRDVMSHVGSVIDSPGYTRSGNDGPDLFFDVSLHVSRRMGR